MSVYRENNHRGAKPRGSRTSLRGAAFYDVDGTLMGLNLVHMALYIFANLGEWSGRLAYLAGFAAKAPMLYMAEQRDRHLLNVILFNAFKGVSGDRLKTVGEEYCERVLIPHLYPHAIEMLEANREAGLEPVLVTGSPDFIIAPLAEHLRVKTFAANRLVLSRGLATGRLRHPVLAGDEKSRWCVEYAAANRLDMRSCWGYADSFYDLPFLAAMGHPVAVNPDRKLLATARSRQWPVVRFEKPAKTPAISLGEQMAEKWLGRALNGAA